MGSQVSNLGVVVCPHCDARCMIRKGRVSPRSAASYPATRRCLSCGRRFPLDNRRVYHYGEPAEKIRARLAKVRHEGGRVG